MNKKTIFLICLFTSVLFCAYANAQIRRLNSSAKSGNIKRMETTSPVKKADMQTVQVPQVSGEITQIYDENVVAIPKQPMREWVIMVYINAKNNLDAESIRNITEMEKVGSNERIAVVAEVGRYEKYAKESNKQASINYWTGNRRYFIQKSDSEETLKITSPVIFKKSQDMGDVNNAISFVNWTKQRFPAKNYMFVLWGHGSGYKDPKIAVPSKGISFDDKSGNYIRTSQITKLLKEIGGVDVFLTNACLMQMMEVIYHMRAGAKFLIGSQDTLYGMEYSEILTSFNAKKPLTPRDASKVLTEETSYYYSTKIVRTPLSLSAIEAEKIPQIIKSLNEWTTAVMQAPDQENAKKAVINAIRNVVRFDDKNAGNFGDLASFVEITNSKINDTTVKEKSKKLLASINSAIVDFAGTSYYFKDEKSSVPTGISIGLPPSNKKEAAQRKEELEISYFEYPFVKNTGWGDFYKWMLAALGRQQ